MQNAYDELTRYGSWGICYTYGTWFGIKGLVAAGKRYQDDDSIRRGCEFLLSNQQLSGGWGESYVACQKMVTCIHSLSHCLNNELRIVFCNLVLFSI